MSMGAVITNLHECAGGIDEKALQACVDGLVMVNTTVMLFLNMQ